MKCEICNFLKEDKFLIYETKYWKVLLHTKDQGYLGRCIVSLKRHCGDLAELNQEEVLDFIYLVKKLESAAKKAFNATMFNWTCLMNNAYQKKPYNPHVHWHFRPRYNHKVNFAGIVFEDAAFGHHYDKGNFQEVSDDVRRRIIEKIRQNL